MKFIKIQIEATDMQKTLKKYIENSTVIQTGLKNNSHTKSDQWIAINIRIDIDITKILTFYTQHSFYPFWKRYLYQKCWLPYYPIF